MSRTALYDIETIKDEVRHLVEQGRVDRHQPIYTLCRYLPTREWACLEDELVENEFLLRDCILDLIGNEVWQDD